MSNLAALALGIALIALIIKSEDHKMDAQRSKMEAAEYKKEVDRLTRLYEPDKLPGDES